MDLSLVQKKANAIRMLMLDVDGVLTDGRIIYINQHQELKIFDVRDGFGLRLVKRAGLQTCIISGRASDMVKLRARELEISEVYQDVHVKLEVYEQVLAKYKLNDSQIAYVGDDLIDLPLLRRVGLAAAVPESPLEVKQLAHYITQHPGGKGAVREVAELILKAQGKWEQVVARYY